MARLAPNGLDEMAPEPARPGRLETPAPGPAERPPRPAIGRSTDRQASGAFRPELLAILAHELRAPLAVIRATVELLDEPPEPDGPTAAELAERLARSVGWLEGLVENLTLWALIEDGQLPLTTRLLPIGTVVDDAVALVAPLLERKGQRVRVECDGPGPVVAADRQRLGRALVNLLANGAAYGPPGEEIVVGVRTGPGWAEVRVVDHGPGVPPGERRRIWQRYARGRAARAGGAPGLGLGLHVVRELVLRHGGQVGVGQGSTGGAAFWIRLPLPPDEPAPTER
jgi:signal transduction histidine kinase